MNKKLFNDCVQAIDACFFLICSNVGLSLQDKICIQHIYEKVGFTLSECFKDSADEG